LETESPFVPNRRRGKKEDERDELPRYHLASPIIQLSRRAYPVWLTGLNDNGFTVPFYLPEKVFFGSQTGGRFPGIAADAFSLGIPSLPARFRETNPALEDQ